VTLYTLYDLCLEISQEGSDTESVLDQLLLDLSCVRTPAARREPNLRLSVYRHANRHRLPPVAREIFWADGFCGLEHGDDFYLTDGASLLHLQARQGQGEAYLAPAFWQKPLPLQRTFWAFSLLRLLRLRGFYSLHAAGLVTPAGRGVLIVGSSGSGKSTLTVGLVRQGWYYLTDDAVLLRLKPAGVAALTLRKHCYVDTSALATYTDLPWGEEVPDRSGRYRRQLRLTDAYPDRLVSHCQPQVLLFACIVPASESTICYLDRLSALKYLLAQSGPQLFDHSSMTQHLDVLKRLVQQTTAYELRAGEDLHQQPGLLIHLLDEAERRRPDTLRDRADPSPSPALSALLYSAAGGRWRFAINSIIRSCPPCL
jgi:hypothetical protein